MLTHYFNNPTIDNSKLATMINQKELIELKKFADRVFLVRFRNELETGSDELEIGIVDISATQTRVLN
jgi:hypothetical protein